MDRWSMHEHIKKFWPKSMAIEHYQKHIDWCKCKMAVQEERDDLHKDKFIAWYQSQINKCLEYIEEINATN